MRASTLILGGAKSGKTALALRLAQTLAPSQGRLVYIATAQALDGEMTGRIRRHQEERGPRWTTLEEPLDLPGALAQAGGPGDVLLVDCLTLWLSNLLTCAGLEAGAVEARAGELCRAVAACQASVILVANEVGLGIVPDNALARAFRDQAGWLNQNLAQVCQNVILVAAGLPLALKGAPPIQPHGDS
ncbi:MAG: bifunctional adenosylcobinamide kinase/adenosylcobinamide-phosphate guanylyltransferase [Desulfarculus sp.]|nr:bifunctional adenosylcobinamide kinase/adenosylcobinamide-phosphate guanylyltransferase [Desulfarculus sp.]